ncbi:MAG: succinylglutamate desuccinylase/aspartoacylase family protein [Bdellovibrio sp.]|nr:succinylglutamate desuccinylase/aspartoacylase family protein [Bdellovibrio sp.]
MNHLSRVDYPIKELPSGDQLFVTTFQIESGHAGPHLHIQASVHGAELQGNAAIFHLMQYFLHNPFKGRVSFVPVSNPTATNTKVGAYTYGRFNPVTGHNWNRCYEDVMTRPEEQIGGTLKSFAASYVNAPWDQIKRDYKTFLRQSLSNLETHLKKKGENENKKLFLFLQMMAAPTDIVLDLHTGPASTRYIYSAISQKTSVIDFHFPFVLNIPNEFAQAMDEATFMPWVHLQRVLKSLGRDVPLEFQSYTLELGSEERVNLDEGKKDAQHILHYLSRQGMIDKEMSLDEKPTQRHILLKDYRTLYAPSGGLVHFHARPGEFVKKGDLLASFLNFKRITDANTFHNALWPMVATEDCFVINHCPSASVSKGMELFQVVENVEVISHVL